MQLAGAKTLTATKASTLPGGTAALVASAPLTVVAGPAARLAFTAQPSGGTAGSAFTVQPQVAVQDTYGNQVLSGSDAALTVSVAPGGGSGPLSGTLSQAASGGVAGFGGLSMAQAQAAATLVASATGSGGAISGTSAPFAVVAGPPTTLAFAASRAAASPAEAWRCRGASSCATAPATW